MSRSSRRHGQSSGSAGQPIAVSFLRYSDPSKQRCGDSTRRQTAESETWCQRNGIPLDQSLHHGGSAFHGRHRDDKAALGQFLRDASDGRVPRGSYLIIENLDRLSREDERTALRLWLDILDAGVNIVQLHPETVFRHDKSDMVDIMRAIIELSRGHSESLMKSVRSLANWEKAVAGARESGQLMTRRVPSWVEIGPSGKMRLVPARAKVVRRIFALAAAGYGAGAIVKKLIAEGVPPFGDRTQHFDDNGKPYWKRSGAYYGCGQWRVSYVRDILKDRRVLGELQPQDRESNPKGEPISNYYPAVLKEAEYFAARTAVLGRKLPAGRIGAKVTCLFSGLLKNARDGSSYHINQCHHRDGTLHRRLLNYSFTDGASRAYTFDYTVFERAILYELRELSPRDVLSPSTIDPTDGRKSLEDELAWVQGKRKELADLLLGVKVREIGEQLRKLDQREKELLAELKLVEEQADYPLDATWRDVRGLTDLLDNATDPVDLRLRLRAALRRIVETIWVLVLARKKDRLALAQMYFAGGATRTYAIFRRASVANRQGHWPGFWQVGSFSSDRVALETDVDLSNPERAGQAAAQVEAMPEWAFLDHWPRHPLP